MKSEGFKELEKAMIAAVYELVNRGHGGVVILTMLDFLRMEAENADE